MFFLSNNFNKYFFDWKKKLVCARIVNFLWYMYFWYPHCYNLLLVSCYDLPCLLLKIVYWNMHAKSLTLVYHLVWSYVSFGYWETRKTFRLPSAFASAPILKRMTLLFGFLVVVARLHLRVHGILPGLKEVWGFKIKIPSHSYVC